MPLKEAIRFSHRQTKQRPGHKIHKSQSATSESRIKSILRIAKQTYFWGIALPKPDCCNEKQTVKTPFSFLYVFLAQNFLSKQTDMRNLPIEKCRKIRSMRQAFHHWRPQRWRPDWGFERVRIWLWKRFVFESLVPSKFCFYSHPHPSPSHPNPLWVRVCLLPLSRAESNVRNFLTLYFPQTTSFR